MPCRCGPEWIRRSTGYSPRLDGTARGMSVLLAALELTRSTDGTLRVVTVEPYLAGEAIGECRPPPRSARLAQSVDRIRLDDDYGSDPGIGSGHLATHLWSFGTDRSLKRSWPR